MARNRHSKTLREEERLLIRRLHGELTSDEEKQLRRREEADPELAERAAAMASMWAHLAPPPSRPTPDMKSQIMAAVRRDSEGLAGSFGHSPWSRLAAGAMLMLGVTFGLSFDQVIERSRGAATIMASVTEPESVGEEGEELLGDFLPMASPSLAEAYWQALEETEGQLSGLEEDEGPIS